MKRVFISYCREDGDVADNIRHKLDEAGIATWQDTDLHGGQDWRAEIDLAIRDALAVIVVMSPEANRSAYVGYEWAFALGVGVNVIPVLLRMDPEILHPALRARQCLDFSNRVSRPWDLLFRAVEGSGPTPVQTTIHLPVGAPPVLEQAVRGLDSLDEKQRAAALDTIEVMQHPAVLDVLVEAAHHPIQDVRFRAGLMLLRRGDKRSLPAVFERLGRPRDRHKIDQDQEERVELAREIAQLGPDASAEFIKVLANPDPSIRQVAAEALGKSGDTAAIPHLKLLLDDRNAEVRYSAVAALGAFHDPALLRVFEEAFRRDELRRVALAAAAAIPGAIGENLLIEALHHEDQDVRHQAATLLVDTATDASLPALREALNDSYGQVRYQAIQAIAKLTGPTAVAALLEALDNRERLVRDCAKTALEKIGGPAVVSGLVEILRSPDKVYRDEAARLLGKLGDQSVVPVVMEALGEADTCAEAAYALGSLAKPGSPAVPALVSLLTHPRDRVREMAMYALEQIADPSTVGQLAGRLDEEREAIRNSAARALQRIGTPEARKAHIAWLRKLRGGD